MDGFVIPRIYEINSRGIQRREFLTTEFTEVTEFFLSFIVILLHPRENRDLWIPACAGMQIGVG